MRKGSSDDVVEVERFHGDGNFARLDYMERARLMADGVLLHSGAHGVCHGVGKGLNLVLVIAAWRTVRHDYVIMNARRGRCGANRAQSSFRHLIGGSSSVQLSTARLSMQLHFHDFGAQLLAQTESFVGFQSIQKMFILRTDLLQRLN